MSCITSNEEIIIISGETLNVSMSFVDAVATDDGVTISSPVVTCSPTGVTIGSATVTSNIVYFSITSSTVGRYVISCSVTSSVSETIIGRGHLRVSS